MRVSLNDRELASVLAGLRFLTDYALQLPGYINDIRDDCGRITPLSPAEIDKLCQRLNAHRRGSDR